MSRTVNLLSADAMRRMLAEPSEGIDPGVFPEYVLCAMGHETLAGTVCQECAHGCSMPGDPECKGRE